MISHSTFTDIALAGTAIVLAMIPLSQFWKNGALDAWPLAVNAILALQLFLLFLLKHTTFLKLFAASLMAALIAVLAYGIVTNTRLGRELLAESGLREFGFFFFIVNLGAALANAFLAVSWVIFRK